MYWNGFEFGEGNYRKRLKIENPNTIYGFNKLVLLAFLKQIFNSSKINLIWCRIFHLYGEKNEKQNRLYPYLLKCKKCDCKPNLTNKKYYYDYLHVKDAANKIFKLIGK